MRNRVLIALVLLLLLSTYKLQNNFYFSSRMNIKEIIVENVSVLNTTDIKSKLSFLYDTNFYFLKKTDIQKALEKEDFVESFHIKKIYPDKIKIKIFEKKPVAILQSKKKKFYFTDKNKILPYRDLKKFENLPVVFGNKESFTIFYSNLKNVGFLIDELKTLYYFESQRWDIVTKKNRTIKLPPKDYKKSLINFNLIKNQINFDKYKIFDYRINNQLILK